MKKKAATHLCEGELRQLNVHQLEAELAQERYAHALTRAELVKYAGEAAALKAEVAARETREQAAAAVRSARDEYSAATQRHEHLTTDIRRTHNLTEKHAIDALSGAIMLPEG